MVPNLEKFILNGCRKLSKVHSSIGNLQHLISLDMKGCESLERLPLRISLTSLRIFILSGCSKLSEFPEIEGNMEFLSDLYLDMSAITKLPTSMVCLTSLTFLSLRGCKNLWHLPSVICNLSSLQCIDLSENDFVSIPESIFQLTELRELHLSRCSKLRSLPTYFPVNLRHVYACECPLLTIESSDLTIWTFDGGLNFIDCRKTRKFKDLIWDPLLMVQECTKSFLPKFLEVSLSLSPYTHTHVHTYIPCESIQYFLIFFVCIF